VQRSRLVSGEDSEAVGGDGAARKQGVGFQRRKGVACAEVPYLQRVIAGGGGGEAAIGRHRHAVHPRGMPFEGADRLPRTEVPHLQRRIGGGGYSEAAIGRQCHAQHLACMPLEGAAAASDCICIARAAERASPAPGRSFTPSRDALRYRTAAGCHNTVTRDTTVSPLRSR
jgi:hypothetical protein